MLQKMYLVLTYFHGIKGPNIILSFPEMVPESLYSTLTGVFDLDAKEPLFEVVLAEENIKITNLNFSIPSEWGRANQEMVMLSVITEKDFKAESFYDLLKDASNNICNRERIYKSLYIDDALPEKDEEVDVKYNELKNVFLTLLSEFENKRREIKIMELVSSRGLSLSGSHNVYGDIMTDLISCLLQEKPIVLCGDMDASTALRNIINRIFLDITDPEKLVSMKGKCEKIETDAFVLNTRLGLVETGEVSNDAHDAINSYLQEANKKGDSDAEFIFLRQKISILLKVADLLEKILKNKKPIKRITKDIEKKLRIKIKVNEIYAVRLILQARGKEEIAERIVVSKFDKF